MKVNEKTESVEILLDDPNSFGNLAKRTLCLMIAAAIFFSLFMLLNEDGLPDFSTLISVITMFILGASFVAYGLFRSRIHPKRFFQFSEDRIQARFQSVESSYSKGGAGALKFVALLLSPDHDELDLFLNELDEIDFSQSEITLLRKGGTVIQIPLSSMGYKHRRQIKEAFQELNAQLQVRGNH